VVGVADVGFIVVGLSEEGDMEVGLFVNGGRELGDMEVGLFENGGRELGDMEVGVAVPSFVGKGVGGVEVSRHSPNDFVSVDWNSPPEMAELPSTSISYEPSPWPQQIPSLNLSVIVNSYAPIGMHTLCEFIELGSV